MYACMYVCMYVHIYIYIHILHLFARSQSPCVTCLWKNKLMYISRSPFKPDCGLVSLKRCTMAWYIHLESPGNGRNRDDSYHSYHSYRDALRGLEFHRSKARESLDKTNPSAWRTSTSNIGNTSRIIEAIRSTSSSPFGFWSILKLSETVLPAMISSYLFSVFCFRVFCVWHVWSHLSSLVVWRVWKNLVAKDFVSSA